LDVHRAAEAQILAEVPRQALGSVRLNRLSNIDAHVDELRDQMAVIAAAMALYLDGAATCKIRDAGVMRFEMLAKQLGAQKNAGLSGDHRQHLAHQHQLAYPHEPSMRRHRNPHLAVLCIIRQDRRRYPYAVALS